MAKQDAVWVEIDPETLAGDQRQAYADYKAAYRMMKEARQAFEALMSADVQTGERMIFGYNFGKLSVAIVEDDRKAAKPKAMKQSLAEYLASRSAHGDRC